MREEWLEIVMMIPLQEKCCLHRIDSVCAVPLMMMAVQRLRSMQDSSFDLALQKMIYTYMQYFVDDNYLLDNRE